MISKRFQDYLFGTAVTQNTAFDSGIFVLRACVGLIMAFHHGAAKIPPSEKFVSGLIEMGFVAPKFFAWCASLSEFLGGLFIAVGFLTRPSATFLGITMAVAGFVRHSADPFKVKELALLYLTIATTLIFLGGGRWSVDALFRKRVKKR